MRSDRYKFRKVDEIADLQKIPKEVITTMRTYCSPARSSAARKPPPAMRASDGRGCGRRKLGSHRTLRWRGPDRTLGPAERGARSEARQMGFARLQPRRDGSRTALGSGRPGLGLYSAAEIAEVHGGTLALSSDETPSHFGCLQQLRMLPRGRCSWPERGISA